VSIPVGYEAEIRWPEDVPMNWDPKDSRFGTHSLANAISWVANEAMHLGAKEITFTAAMKLGKRGQPMEDARQRGPIAVWYTTDETPNPVCIAIGEYHFLVDNLWAVGHTLAAMRTIRRHAGDWAARQSQQGFAALPPKRKWWETLGVTKDSPREVVEAAYRALARKAHPDRGGSHEAMTTLNAAIDEFRFGGAE
jgi:hypothetical protein